MTSWVGCVFLQVWASSASLCVCGQSFRWRLLAGVFQFSSVWCLILPGDELGHFHWGLWDPMVSGTFQDSACITFRYCTSVQIKTYVQAYRKGLRGLSTGMVTGRFEQIAGHYWKKKFTTGGRPSLPVCICFQQHNVPGLGDSWWLESEIMEESVKIFLLSESNYFPVDKWPYTSSWKVKWNHRAVGQPLPPYSQLNCLPQCPVWLWLS